MIVALQRRGLAIGTMRLLSVPGRKSGRLRTTPVSPMSLNGRRYIVAGLEGADWVKNAREAGWGLLGRGRRLERAALVELALEERVPILREFVRQVPGGRRFFTVSPDAPPEEFAAVAPRYPIFRVEERVFPGVLKHTYDYPRKDPQRALDDRHVAYVEWVEGPGENGKRCVGFGHDWIVAPGQNLVFSFKF